MKIYKILILILIVTLTISFIGQIFIVIINPEVFLFGEKLGGDKARIYLLTDALIGILPIALLLRRRYQSGIILTAIYFGYNLYWIYISYHTVGSFVVLSFIVSILALIFLKLKL